MRNAYKKLIINQRRNNKIINELKVDNIEDKSENAHIANVLNLLSLEVIKEFKDIDVRIQNVKKHLLRRAIILLDVLKNLRRTG